MRFTKMLIKNQLREGRLGSPSSLNHVLRIITPESLPLFRGIGSRGIRTQVDGTQTGGRI